MHRIIILGLLLISSCTERELVNKELIGKWELENLSCKKTDAIKELSTLRNYEEKYFRHFTLTIHENSRYVFIANTITLKFNQKKNQPEQKINNIEEHGLIIMEEGNTIQWKPQFIMEDKEKSHNFVAESAKADNYKFKCEFGSLPGRKTNKSSFFINNNRLTLVNDVRLSYYENKTGRASDDKQLETTLVFIRK